MRRSFHLSIALTRQRDEMIGFARIACVLASCCAFVTSTTTANAALPITPRTGFLLDERKTIGCPEAKAAAERAMYRAPNVDDAHRNADLFDACAIRKKLPSEENDYLRLLQASSLLMAANHEPEPESNSDIVRARVLLQDIHAPELPSAGYAVSAPVLGRVAGPNGSVSYREISAPQVTQVGIERSYRDLDAATRTRLIVYLIARELLIKNKPAALVPAEPEPSSSP